MDDNGNSENEEITLDQEEASSPVEEASIPAEPVNLNEELCDKLLDSAPPKVSLSRVGVKSVHTEHVVLLGKMDPTRLRKNQNIIFIVALMSANIAES